MLSLLMETFKKCPLVNLIISFESMNIITLTSFWGLALKQGLHIPLGLQHLHTWNSLDLKMGNRYQVLRSCTIFERSVVDSTYPQPLVVKLEPIFPSTSVWNHCDWNIRMPNLYESNNFEICHYLQMEW